MVAEAAPVADTPSPAGTGLEAAVTKPRPATVHDVARLAGVSAQTVSRLVGGSTGIRPQTRRRVEDAIHQLEYTPNQAARLLRTRRSRRIGVLVHHMFEFGPATLLRGAAAEAEANGHTLGIVGVDGSDARAVQDAFDTFEAERVAAVLAITLTDEVREVVARRRPTVPFLVDPSEHVLGGPSGSEAGAALAAEHLLALGHRRFGLVLGPQSWLPARQRRLGFEAAAAAAGAETVILGEGDWTPASGASLGNRFDPASGITAVFASNDDMAIGFVHATVDRGLRVPADLSVVGFDGGPHGAFVRPALTSIRSDFASEGHAAVAALLAAIAGTGPTVHAPSVTLLHRASSAAAPA